MMTQEVTFIKREMRYDPAQGKQVPIEEVLKTMWINVTDVGLERKAKLYGNVKRAKKELHFMPFILPPEDYTHVIIDGREWQELTRIGVRRVTIVVEEV